MCGEEHRSFLPELETRLSCGIPLLLIRAAKHATYLAFEAGVMLFCWGSEVNTL